MPNSVCLSEGNWTARSANGKPPSTKEKCSFDSGLATEQEGSELAGLGPMRKPAQVGTKSVRSDNDMLGRRVEGSGRSRRYAHPIKHSGPLKNRATPRHRGRNNQGDGEACVECGLLITRHEIRESLSWSQRQLLACLRGASKLVRRDFLLIPCPHAQPRTVMTANRHAR